MTKEELDSCVEVVREFFQAQGVSAIISAGCCGEKRPGVFRTITAISTFNDDEIDDEMFWLAWHAVEFAGKYGSQRKENVSDALRLAKYIFKFGERLLERT